MTRRDAPAEPSLPDKVVALHHALGGAGIAHAFGGALALAYYAEPRATVDVDLNVFVTVAHAAEVAAAIAPLGLDTQALFDPAVERDGQVRCRWGRTPIDVFFAYDPVHDAMRAASRVEPFGDDEIPVLGPEHLVVCKAVFDRPKDRLDIDQILATVEGLDLVEIRHWLGEMLAPGDARRARFERSVAELLGS